MTKRGKEKIILIYKKTRLGQKILFIDNNNNAAPPWRERGKENSKENLQWWTKFLITKIGLNTGIVVYILKYLKNCTLMLTVRYVSKSSDSIITAITYISFYIM